MQTDGDISPRHFAFQVSEPEFDDIFGRIQAQGLDYWADPPGANRPHQSLGRTVAASIFKTRTATCWKS
jgi:hypothetical protein